MLLLSSICTRGRIHRLQLPVGSSHRLIGSLGAPCYSPCFHWGADTDADGVLPALATSRPLLRGTGSALAWDPKIRGPEDDALVSFDADSVDGDDVEDQLDRTSVSYGAQGSSVGYLLRASGTVTAYQQTTAHQIAGPVREARTVVGTGRTHAWRHPVQLPGQSTPTGSAQGCGHAINSTPWLPWNPPRKMLPMHPCMLDHSNIGMCSFYTQGCHAALGRCGAQA